VFIGISIVEIQIGYKAYAKKQLIHKTKKETKIYSFLFLDKVYLYGIKLKS